MIVWLRKMRTQLLLVKELFARLCTSNMASRKYIYGKRFNVSQLPQITQHKMRYKRYEIYDMFFRFIMKLFHMCVVCKYYKSLLFIVFFGNLISQQDGKDLRSFKRIYRGKFEFKAVINVTRRQK